MFSDNPILSRSLAVLLLGVLLAGIWTLSITPIIDKRTAYKTEIDRAQRLITAFEARQERIGVLKRQLTTLRSDRSSTTAYFTARNATLAAAKLQSRIKTLTQAAGAGLTSSQVLTADDTKEELQRVTVRAHMVGSIEAVRSVFHTLETGQPYVFLENVTISAGNSGRTNRRRVRQQADDGRLNVRYEAYGFLWRKKQS